MTINKFNKKVKTIVAGVAITTGAFAQQLAPHTGSNTLPNSWHASFTGSQESETLTMKDGDLYLYRGGGEQPLVVGTLRGRNMGRRRVIRSQSGR
jgi:hypothetical protein